MNQLFFDDGRDCFSNGSEFSPLFALFYCRLTRCTVSLLGGRPPCGGGDGFGNPCFPVYPQSAVPVPIPLQPYSNGQECVVQPMPAVPVAVQQSKMMPLHKRKHRPPRKQQSESIHCCCCPFHPLHFVTHKCRDMVSELRGSFYLARLTLLVGVLLQVQGFAFLACTCCVSWFCFFPPTVFFSFFSFFFVSTLAAASSTNTQWTYSSVLSLLCLMIPQKRLRGRVARNCAESLPLPPDLPGKTTTASFLAMAHFNTTPQRKKSARNTKTHTALPLYISNSPLLFVMEQDVQKKKMTTTKTGLRRTRAKQTTTTSRSTLTKWPRRHAARRQAPATIHPASFHHRQ